MTSPTDTAPMTALRDAVAVLCDPDAWALRETLRGDPQLEERISGSLTLSDQILATVFAVLREPTDDMINAGVTAQYYGKTWGDKVRGIFQAMLAEAERAAADGKGE